MWRRTAFALLFGALLWFALPAFADSHARIVRLSYLDGNVDVDRGDGSGPQRAILNMPIVQGTTVVTHDGATAEVEFEDGSAVRLTPESKVSFPNLSLRDSGERVSAADLASGTAYFDLKDKKGDFTVTSAGETVTSGKASRFRLSREGSEVRIAVFKGEAEIHTARAVNKVKKNETFLADASDPERDQLAKGIDAETLDSWAQQRDQYQQTYASNHNYGYSPLYSYGWSDLNYFGGFNNYPGYGYLWRPFGVSSAWDPFSDGAWMMYPGYGWMFVSANPWGWMPYRYGSWQFVPGFGWAWQPGYWNNWYGVPVIASAPTGFVGPHPPATGGGIVSVGHGPMHGIKDPRFDKWVSDAASNPGAHRGRRAAVNPVAVPATTNTGAAQPAGSTTQQPPTATPHSGHHGGGKTAPPTQAPRVRPARPQSQIAPPVEAAPAQRQSMGQMSSGASSRGGMRSAPSSGGHFHR